MEKQMYSYGYSVHSDIDGNRDVSFDSSCSTDIFMLFLYFHWINYILHSPYQRNSSNFFVINLKKLKSSFHWYFQRHGTRKRQVSWKKNAACYHTHLVHILYIPKKHIFLFRLIRHILIDQFCSCHLSFFFFPLDLISIKSSSSKIKMHMWFLHFHFFSVPVFLSAPYLG